MELQPLLHNLLVATMAPTQAWSGPDGQIRPLGAQGIYQGDMRLLCRAVLTVDGQQPEVISAGPAGAGAVEVMALLRTVDEPGPDPTLRLRRTRQVAPGTVRETLELAAGTESPIQVPLALELACDLAEMEDVKSGRVTRLLPASIESELVVWSNGEERVTIRCDSNPEIDLEEPTAPVLRWFVTVQPGERTLIQWELTAMTQPDAVVGAAPEGATWSTPVVASDDRRLPLLLNRALEDLSTLRMTANFAPNDVVLASGAPWFFTLFGRESIQAAWMMLPLGTDLAGGVLRSLAAKQGVVTDPETAEQPGKILHEVRRSRAVPHDDGGWSLPPVYYGTIDATPLWVCLLHDAWRWGMPSAEVKALLPAMEAALGWMTEHGDADGDGFLEYLDPTGRGLANQGWKDSGDAVQWQNGSLATGPIALCEVQGYAYAAAIGGAALLEAFGRPGAEGWRTWAAALGERFRQQFWVEDAEGAYPAIALDADKRAVDTLTSNIGHLLGTGLLTSDEESKVARRLGSQVMDSGYGLRTLSSESRGYWPMRYHGGTVWTHDTAIAVAGLARAGHHDTASSLAEGLLAAASEMGYRLPELHSGDARGSVPAVVPYPAACRPQAWPSASAALILSSILGVVADVSNGTLHVSPMAPSPVGAIRVTGLRVAGHNLDVEVDAAGSVVSVHTDAPLRIIQTRRT